MTRYHTPECLAYQQECQAEAHAYDLAWPGSCPRCGGGGEFVELDPDAGYMGEPCPDCTEQGRCARCGEPGLTSEDRGDPTTGDGPCSACGWNYDSCRPYQFDGYCDCEERKEEEHA